MPDVGGVDGTTALVILGTALAVMVIGVLALTTYVVMRPRVRLKNRMASYGMVGKPGRFSGGEGRSGGRQSRIQERLQELEDKSKQRKRRYQIRSDLMQAGVDTTIRQYVTTMVLIGVVTAVVMFVAGLPPLAALPGGLIAGLGVPKAGLKMMASIRQKKFTQNFANAVDVLIRGIKSGLPVGECLSIIAREAPDPVGTEFHLLVEGQKVGVTMETLLTRGLERMPTAEYKFFSIVLLIQQQTGGNLAETLEGLSNVLRERKKMKDKVKAMSSEAKASAAIIGSLPFFVAGVVSVMSPEYLDRLFVTDVGHMLIAGGLTWMGLGILVMWKMINFDF
jgi:tight adherence protein B